MAEVALPVTTVVSIWIDFPLGTLLIFLPADKVVREEAVAILLPDELVQGLAVDARSSGAGARLEVSTCATCSAERSIAAGTVD